MGMSEVVFHFLIFLSDLLKEFPFDFDFVDLCRRGIMQRVDNE